MSHSSTDANRLFELAGAICDETASHRDRLELKAMMLVDPASRLRYLDYCQVHATLRLQLRANRASQNVYQQIKDELVTKSPTESDSAAVEPPVSNAPHFPTGLWCSPVADRSSGWLVAYLVAMVIVGVGLATMAVVPVSRTIPLVATSSQSDGEKQQTLAEKVEQKGEIVGQITGMVDCKWDAPKTIPTKNARVLLGQTYTLASGVMEITYDTGAKVILQGPGSYEVESKNGGFLSVGKLTARLKKKEGLGARSEERTVATSTLLIPHSLFAVRTPTAVVTDLGTEFGVEVDNRGGTQSYVFRGRVLVQPTACKGKTSQAIQLDENQSVQIDSSERGSVVRDRVDPTKFIRAIGGGKPLAEPKRTRFENWLTYSRKLRLDPSLVVYYSMERHDQGTSILPNQSPLGSEMDGKVVNAEWVEGRLPGKLALYFRGPGSGDTVTIPHQERFQFAGPFSVAVWFKSDAFSVWWQTLIAKGNNSWRFQRHEATRYLCFDADCFDDGKQNLPRTFSRTEVDDRQWHFAVGVYEPAGNVAKRRLYIDGQSEAVNDVALPLQQNGRCVSIGCNPSSPGREFHGFVDEVAIFSRALSAEEIAQWFQTGSSTNGRSKGKTAK